MSNSIYLDHAAATPMSDAVLSAMTQFWQDGFYNPSATYLPARSVHDALGSARQQVAEVLGARAAEITFTAGGTEANNLAIFGVMAHYPAANVVTTAIEHDSVLESVRRYNHREAAVLVDGTVNVDAFLSNVNDQTVLVSVMYANNEVGSVLPIREITQRVDDICRQRRKTGNNLPLYVHTDAAQAANYLDLHVARLGIDLMTLNGGKIYGPKQSGVLYVRGGTTLTPLIVGGGQEHGLRSGTENVAASVGFATALAETQSLRHEETVRLQSLQNRFYRTDLFTHSKVQLNGTKQRRLPNNIHLTLPATDNERVLLQLEQAGILAAAGSACSASSEKPSHVLAAMGLTEAEARSSLRFTMGRSTDEAAIDRLTDALTTLLQS